MRTVSKNRRTFLARTLVGATASMGIGCRAHAASARTLTMVTTWPRGAPGVGVNAQRFADRVTQLSGGRLQVRFFAGGELVPPFEALDAVQQGTADLVHSSPYYWVGKSKALHYFTGVPFGMTAIEFCSWLYFGDGQALWEAAYEPFKVLPLYAGSSGTQAGGWFNREINTVADLKGLKFRIAGLGGEVMRRLGATPVMTAPAEIAPALASGAVDGADWVGPWNDIAFGLHKFARFYYMPGFHEPGPSLEVIVSRRAYDKLSPELQAVLRCAAQATALETLSDFMFHNIETFALLEKKYGVRLRRFTPEVVTRLRQVSFQVLDELAASDALTGRIHAAYMGFLDKAKAYAPHAEQGFLVMRATA
ncbi:MAG: TRAP transporter substrate-binding protein [Acidiferrobacterales bacterium]|nr:TRAP transporter substrate-binding protein [Acidiferrobacterales bacterium]